MNAPRTGFKGPSGEIGLGAFGQIYIGYGGPLRVKTDKPPSPCNNRWPNMVDFKLRRSSAITITNRLLVRFHLPDALLSMHFPYNENH